MAKVSAYDSAVPVLTDVLYLVDDPGGTPVSKKTTTADVLNLTKTAVTVGTNTGEYITDGTDDQVQIQAAIDAVNTAGGGIVFIKAGTYTTSDVITLKDNVWIIGAGWTTIIKSSGATAYSVFEYLGSGVSDQLFNSAIMDLKIDGSDLVTASYSTSSKGIFTQYTERFLIKNVWCFGCGASGIGTDFMVDCIIDSCVAESNGRQWPGEGNYGSNGIGIGTGAYDEETLLIANCHAVNNGNNGIMFEQQAAAIQSKVMHVNNCISRGNNHGYRNAGAAEVIFSDCSASENTKAGFFMDASPFGGNVAQRVIFDSCLIVENGQSGIEFDGSSETAIRNIRITNNMIFDNGNNGIRSNAGNRWVINNNTIGQNDLSGIKFNPTAVAVSYLDIKNNQIWNNGTDETASDDDGILLSASASGSFVETSIEGNHFFDNQGNESQDYAIQISGTHSDTVLRNNFVKDQETGGILLNTAGTNTIIRGNIGHTTENSGTATLVSGTTSIAVNHGLAETPAAGDIMITPMESLGSATEFYIDTYTSTQFTINVDVNPGQDVDFAWTAAIY